MTSFSLVTEPWLSCQAPDGGTLLVSLHDVFDGRHPVAGLRGDSPTQDYALLRLLLAIQIRAHATSLTHDASSDLDFIDWWEGQWAVISAGGADETTLAYLDRFGERFDLAHDRAPFMQVAQLHTASDARLPVSRIIPEAENDYFTMRTGAARQTLDFAEAARWLVHTQAYDYSGIKSGAVGDPRIKNGKGYPIGQGWTGLTGGTTVVGASLRETLLLNTTADGIFGGPGDIPAWEREPDGPSPRPVAYPAGVADILTWQSRRVRLFHDGERVTSVLVSNGDPVPNAGANVLVDPMTPYRYSPNKSTKSQAVFYPRPYDTNRMMWRSLEPLICLDGDHPNTGPLALKKGEHAPQRPRTLSQLAMLRSERVLRGHDVLTIRLTSASYGPQASSASTTVDARVELPRSLLQEDRLYARLQVLTVARATLDAGICLGQFAGELLRAAGGEYAFQPNHTDGILADLEPLFHSWLRELDTTSVDLAAARWESAVSAEVIARAHTLLRGAGPRALIGREVVENERAVFHSAGTAYARLLSRLRDALPLTLHHPSAHLLATPTDSKETADVV